MHNLNISLLYSQNPAIENYPEENTDKKTYKFSLDGYYTLKIINIENLVLNFLIIYTKNRFNVVTNEFGCIQNTVQKVKKKLFKYKREQGSPNLTS